MELWVWGGVDGLRVACLFTQEAAAAHGSNPGNATLGNVNHALKALAAECRREQWPSLALPRLATGVGGLEWAQVKPLVEKHLGELGIPVIVYETFHAGVKGDEGLPARG